jgi:hypothetical protein
MKSQFKKVKWRVILRQWTALIPAEKLIALTILARSDKEGWAKLSLGELQEASGGLHYHTIHEAIKQLQKLNALQLAPSDHKRKKLYRLHESTLLRK